MPDYYYILKPFLLLAEITAAVVGLFYLPKLKNSYWNIFVFYLVFIALQEAFWHFFTAIDLSHKQVYYAYVGIPIQYIFFYWLYGSKSLGNQKLFLICSCLYLLTYIPIELFFKELEVIYSLNPTIGTLFLIIFILLEFVKQIKDDSILYFRQNKMFYINIGVILLYIGTFPLFCFYIELANDYKEIWIIYYAYFLIANITMYSLFALSFIWGNHRLK